MTRDERLVRLAELYRKVHGRTKQLIAGRAMRLIERSTDDLGLRSELFGEWQGLAERRS